MLAADYMYNIAGTDNLAIFPAFSRKQAMLQATHEVFFIEKICGKMAQKYWPMIADDASDGPPCKAAQTD